MANDFNIELGVSCNDNDVNKIIADINKRVCAVEVRFKANNQLLKEISEQLNSFIIKPTFDSSELERQTKKTLSKLEAISGTAKNAFTNNFDIVDKKTLNELSKLAADWVKAFKSSDNATALNISGDMLKKTYEGIKELDSEINLLEDSYKEFVDYVNKSKIKMQPFGADYEDVRRSIVIGVVGKTKGTDMDIWYQEARDYFPQMLPDVENVEDQFEALAEAMRIGREKIKKTRITEEEIEARFGGKNGIDRTFGEVMTQILSVSKEIDKAAVKLNPSLFDDTQGYESAQARIKEIRESVDELAQIKIETTPIDENGEKVEKITKAVLTYKDEVGRAATETMKWVDSVSEFNGEILKGKSFETVKVDYTDNVQQIEKMAEEAAVLKEKLTVKLDNLGMVFFPTLILKDLRK